MSRPRKQTFSFKGKKRENEALDDASQNTVKEADILLKKGDIDTAKVIINALIRKHPNNADCCWLFGRLCAKHGRYDPAISNYQQCLQLDRCHADCYCSYGAILHILKRYNEEEEMYEKCLQIEATNHRCHYNYALLMMRRGDHVEAEKHYITAVELYNDDPMYYIEYGKLLTILRRNQEAQQQFIKALKLDPNNDFAYFLLAKLLKQMGQITNAMINAKKAAKLNPQNKEYQKYIHQLNLVKSKRMNHIVQNSVDFLKLTSVDLLTANHSMDGDEKEGNNDIFGDDWNNALSETDPFAVIFESKQIDNVDTKFISNNDDQVDENVGSNPFDVDDDDDIDVQCQNDTDNPFDIKLDTDTVDNVVDQKDIDDPFADLMSNINVVDSTENKHEDGPNEQVKKGNDDKVEKHANKDDELEQETIPNDDPFSDLMNNMNKQYVKPQEITEKQKQQNADKQEENTKEDDMVSMDPFNDLINNMQNKYNMDDDEKKQENIININSTQKQMNDVIVNGPTKQFHHFLKECRLEQYFDKLKENDCADIRYIEYWMDDDEFIENNLGIKSKIHRRRLVGECRKLKKQMDAFKSANIIPSILLDKLDKYGIVTMNILCTEIQNKNDLRNKVNINNSKQCELLWNIINMQMHPEIHDTQIAVEEDINNGVDAPEGVNNYGAVHGDVMDTLQ